MSHTLEYAYSDWGVGRFVEAHGNQADADEYYRRSQAYTNLWSDHYNHPDEPCHHVAFLFNYWS